jgi:hypothetical protein
VISSTLFSTLAAAAVVTVAALVPARAHAGLAEDLAAALDIPAGVLVEASLDGSDPRGAAVMTAGQVPGFPAVGQTYVLLSTGLAVDATLPDDNAHESARGALHLVGDGASDDRSTVLTGLANSRDGDLVRLRLVLRPPADARTVRFRFAFYTEEFPDFLASEFNDVFVAELGASTLRIADDGAITAPDNVAFDAGGKLISVNAAFGFDPATPNPDTGTTFDGTTGLLETVAPIRLDPATGTFTIIFTITDVNDSVLDSAVALDGLDFLPEVTPPSTAPVKAPRSTALRGGGGCSLSAPARRSPRVIPALFLATLLLGILIAARWARRPESPASR